MMKRTRGSPKPRERPRVRANALKALASRYLIVVVVGGVFSLLWRVIAMFIPWVGKVNSL